MKAWMKVAKALMACEGCLFRHEWRYAGKKMGVDIRQCARCGYRRVRIPER